MISWSWGQIRIFCELQWLEFKNENKSKYVKVFEFMKGASTNSRYGIPRDSRLEWWGFLAENIVLFPEALQTLPSHYLLTIFSLFLVKVVATLQSCPRNAGHVRLVQEPPQVCSPKMLGDQFLLIKFNQIHIIYIYIYIYNFLFLHIFKFASVIAHGSCSLSGEPRAGAFYRTAVGCEKNAIVLDVPGTEHGDIRGVGHERSVKTCEPLVNLKMFSWKPRIEEPTTIIPHM